MFHYSYERNISAPIALFNIQSAPAQFFVVYFWKNFNYVVLKERLIEKEKLHSEANSSAKINRILIRWRYKHETRPYLPER